MNARHVLLAFVAGLFLASGVMAQPPDGGSWGRGKGRDGGGRGDRERGPDSGGGGPAKFQGGPSGDSRGGWQGGPPAGFQGGPQGGDPRQQFMEMMLARYDTNKDGTITPAEVAAFDERMKSRYERTVRDAGLDPTQPIKVGTLKEAMARNMTSRGGPPGSGPPGSPFGMAAGGSKPGQGPGQSSVPGFGVEARPVSVATFSPAAGNVPGGPRPGPGAPPSPIKGDAQKPTPPASPPGDKQAEARAKEMADGILRQNDKNGNGVLDKKEAEKLPGGLRNADRNGDGVITRDELTAQMLEFSRGRGGEGRGGPDRFAGPGRGGPSSATAGVGRQSNRLHTAQERVLPQGLPDFFSPSDADHDGQITMAEYGAGREWSDAMARDFDKWDLNHDGIVTPAECLKVAGQK